MQKCVESIIWGKNLGYNYLLWIQKHAIRLGLKGITFFKTDGSIKTIAEGEEKKLLFFIKKLRRGRSLIRCFSQVENFSVTWKEPKNKFRDFSITESGE